MANRQQVSSSAVRKASEIKQWDWQADVVIVGYGCAGACAAIEAAEAGADVLVLERAGTVGGTTVLSGGIFYLGGGTPVQIVCGFEDTPEEMYKFLMAAMGPSPDAAMIRVYCDENVAHFHWLEAHGVPFKREFSPDVNMPPATDAGLCYMGGENAYPFDRIAKPAPRGHKPQVSERMAGNFLMARLAAATERSGARVEYTARTETLVVNDAKRVVGVVVRQHDRERFVHARRGVVLTAGGFTTNREMVAQHVPLIEQCGSKLEVEACDGSAIRMGMGAGADIIHMSAVQLTFPFTPHRLMRGILVNQHGQRFINEDTDYGRKARACVFGQDGGAFLIVDAAIYEPLAYTMEADFRARTVRELEQLVSLPPGSLQVTLAYYNRFAKQRQDPLFHKGPELVEPLVTPPYAAFDLRVHVHPHMWGAMTLGGIRTQPTGKVLDPDGHVIRGLYAAGRTTCGLARGGYCPGIAHGEGSFFGRKAGRSATMAEPHR